MLLKTLLAAATLALTPAFAFAMCSHDHQEAMSCMDGLVWDPETRSCVQQLSG